MAGQTDLVLEALGVRDRRRILMALLQSDRSEKELRVLLAMDQTTASRGLTHLRLVGLVDRERPRGAYRACFKEATTAFLTEAVKLANMIASERDAEDDSLGKELGF